MITLFYSLNWGSVSWTEVIAGAILSGIVGILIAFIPSLIRKWLPNKNDYVLNCKEIKTNWQLVEPDENTNKGTLRIIQIKSTIHIKNDGKKDLGTFSQFKPFTITVPDGYQIKDIEFDKYCQECSGGKILGLNKEISEDKRSAIIHWTLFKSKYSACATIYAEKEIDYLHFNKSEDLSFFKELNISFEFPNLLSIITSKKSQTSIPADYCLINAMIFLLIFIYSFSLPSFRRTTTSELSFVVENIGSSKQLSNKHLHFGEFYYDLDNEQIEFISHGKQISFSEEEINDNLRIKYIKAPIDEIEAIKERNSIRVSIKLAMCCVGLIGFIAYFVLALIVVKKNNKS
jgi:hypothetical protein